MLFLSRVFGLYGWFGELKAGPPLDAQAARMLFQVSFSFLSGVRLGVWRRGCHSPSFGKGPEKKGSVVVCPVYLVLLFYYSARGGFRRLLLPRCYKQQPETEPKRP